MDVAVIHGNEFNVAKIISKLAGWFRVTLRTFDTYYTDPSSEAAAHLFCSSLVTNEQFRRVRKAVETCVGEKVFVFPTHNKKNISRLQDLNGGDYFTLPVNGSELRDVVKHAVNRRTEGLWADLDPTTQAALKKSLECFNTCFSRIQRGEPLPIDDIYASSRHIRIAACAGSFDTWIDALANHHNYSFRHSMFACGALTYFAHSIGIGATDLERLTVGGLVHDIGKSMIPIEILDKPGELNEAEWRIMRKHPIHARDILIRERDVDPGIIAMAVHHHEKLDGTGYPYGLSGTQIDDCTRLIAIADVYSALIDERCYKSAMTNEQALDLMASFEGHFDMDLFKAFRNFALRHG